MGVSDILNHGTTTPPKLGGEYMAGIIFVLMAILEAVIGYLVSYLLDKIFHKK